MSDTVRVGTLIKAARDQAGYTTSEFAQRMQMTKQYVAQVDNGQRPPSEEYIRRASSLLGLDPDTLVARSGKAPKDVLELLLRQPTLMRLVRAASGLRKVEIEKLAKQLESLKGE